METQKCKYLGSKFQYLGLIVSENRIHMDTIKVKAVIQWLAQNKLNKLQRFIGCLTFYQQLNDHLFSTTQPPKNLTKLNSLFMGINNFENAFQSLLTAFTSVPILTIVDPYKDFSLQCNFLESTLAARFSQNCKNDCELHLVTFILFIDLGQTEL